MMTAKRKSKKRIVWLAVSGINDRSFDTYSQACAWLDKISPETATSGFTTEDHRDDEEVKTIIVRHTDW